MSQCTIRVSPPSGELVMSCGSYLMDTQCNDEPVSAGSDLDWSVLDAIEAAGPAGADMESLASRTRYDNALLNKLLRNLRNAGLARSTAEMRYRVTSLGETARRLAAF